MTPVWNWTPEAEKDAKEAFDLAFELGIPLYDTGKTRTACVMYLLYTY